MNQTKNVAVLVGSLRRQSVCKALALEFARIAPAGLAFNLIPIGTLPFYNPDEEEDAPSSWTGLRRTIRDSDAVLFILPEYNRSIPAVLKNAIDVASRPYQQSAWNGKPAAIVSISPGKLGGFGANHQLRQSLACLNMPILPAPEIYLEGANTLVDANGTLQNPSTEVFLAMAMQKFQAWIELHTGQQ